MDHSTPVPPQANLRRAVMFLVILAVLDSILTDSGIRLHFISEANPLMNIVYENSIFGFYVLKISLPLLLLLVLTKIKAKPYLNYLIGFTLFLYSVILFLHFTWISIVLLA